MRLGQISDLHLDGHRATHALAQRACAEILLRSPDLICVTGDVVQRMQNRPEGVRMLGQLSAPGGVYLVLGNHDCSATLEDFLWGEPGDDTTEPGWRQALADTPVTLLDNEWHATERNGERLVVAGVGDVSVGRDDLPAALRGAPQGGLRLLLSHSPDVLDLPDVEWADLVLCGHTHGGQLQLPRLGSAWAPVWRLRQRASGLLRLGHTAVFVTRGVGAGVRLRFNCPPQVAVLTLVPGSLERLPATAACPLPQEASSCV